MIKYASVALVRKNVAILYMYPIVADVLTKEVQVRLLFGWLLRMNGCDNMSLGVLEMILKRIKSILVVKIHFPTNAIYVRKDSLPELLRFHTWRCDNVGKGVDGGDVIKYPGIQDGDYQCCSQLYWCEECSSYIVDEYDDGDNGQIEKCFFCEDRVKKVSEYLLKHGSMVMSDQTVFDREKF